MGIAEARAKLLLLGEHAAVYGAPALGCTLPWVLTARYEPGTRWAAPGLGPHEAIVMALLRHFAELARQEGWPVPVPGPVEITSAIPVGSGFGSSGALCGALTDLLFPSLSEVDRDRLAWRAEHLFHGTPSGIDTALARRQGWWALDASVKPALATALPDPQLTMVVGALVRSSDTKTLVGELARRRASGDSLVLDALRALGEIAARAVDQLARHQLQNLPSLILGARQELKTLGLESPSLTSVLDAGLACPGAAAGKLSGAGGGGAFFLLFQTPDLAAGAVPVIEAAVSPPHWTSRPRVI